MVFYCSECWQAIPEGSSVCPHCKADIQLASNQPFAVKLRRALHHSEPETPPRAAWILGELREQSAVPDLINLLGAIFNQTSKAFLAESVADALGKIGDQMALPVLRIAATRGTLRVRRAAQLAIEKILEGSSPLKMEPNKK